MPRKAIHAAGAPKAIGPYSQAVSVDPGKLIFLSGQIPLDPSTGELVGGDIAVQTERVMKNLEAVLKEAGADFSHVVRSTIFLADLGDFVKVNEVYGKAFSGAPPARVTIQAAALPKGARVKIDAIAVL